jgi:hypothetical protein
MIRYKLPNKTKNTTIAEPKLFHQLNKPVVKYPAPIWAWAPHWFAALHDCIPRRPAASALNPKP